MYFASVVSFCVFFGRYLVDSNIMRMCADRLSIPRVIWTHWEGVIPEDIDEMISVTRLSLENFTYHLVTPSNLPKFLDVRDFHKDYLSLHVAGRADYIRVCLLQRYGGVWVDSSVYVNSGSEMEWFFLESINGKAEVTTFSGHNEYPFSFLPSFFGAVENSSFMQKFKKEFDLIFEMGVSLYNEKSSRELHMERSNPYYIVLLIVTKVGLSDEKLKNAVQILSTNRSSYRLIMECQKGRMCFRNRLLRDPIARSYPFIKVWHHFRDGKRFYTGQAKYEK